MSLSESKIDTKDALYVLVTGANSGLGLGIGTRLVDEFLQTRPQTETLVLIVTTRDQRKGDATIKTLQQHLGKIIQKHEQEVPGISQLLQNRVQFRQERLDLLNLISVQKLCKKLRQTTPRLDVVICNAGIGGWTGINWPLAIGKVLTGLPRAVSWPTFKISGVGWLCKPQIPRETRMEEPPLGEVFCANFFGHYLLGHYLGSHLAKHSSNKSTKGRLIWVSSLEAYDHTLDLNDIQAIAAMLPYESTKRLTDVMAITSIQPSISDIVDEYLEYPRGLATTSKPRIYVTHPGICGTSILPLPFPLVYLMLAAFYIARWCGSQWHSIDIQKGACSMVWLTLAKQSTLDSMEAAEGIGKWGSACDFWGQERVERTEVAGWGWGGRLNEYKRKAWRDPHAQDLSEENRQRLLETGKACWEQMEKLRIEWEERLKKAHVGVDMDEN